MGIHTHQVECSHHADRSMLSPQNTKWYVCRQRAAPPYGCAYNLPRHHGTGTPRGMGVGTHNGCTNGYGGCAEPCTRWVVVVDPAPTREMSAFVRRGYLTERSVRHPSGEARVRAALPRAQELEEGVGCAVCSDAVSHPLSSVDIATPTAAYPYPRDLVPDKPLH